MTHARFEGLPLDEIKAQLERVSDALNAASGRDVDELVGRRNELRLELVGASRDGPDQTVIRAHRSKTSSSRRQRHVIVERRTSA